MIVFIPQVTFFPKYFFKGTFNLRLSAVSIMETWDILSASPLQSTTSDTPTTQQRFPCPTHQDAGESNTPCISRWVGCNPWRMQTGATVAAGPHVLSPGSGGWPCSPSKPCAVGEVAHTTPASCACRTHGHREPGTSDSRAHDGPAPPVVKAVDSAPRLPHGVPTNATTLEMAQKPWPWLPSPAIPQQQCPQAHTPGMQCRGPPSLWPRQWCRWQQWPQSHRQWQQGCTNGTSSKWGNRKWLLLSYNQSAQVRGSETCVL